MNQYLVGIYYYIFLQINELIIGTDETVKQQYFLQALLKNEIPLLFVGPTGTGKSAIVLDYLMNLPKEKFLANVLNFSARTAANTVQDIIISKLDKYNYIGDFCLKNVSIQSLPISQAKKRSIWTICW